MEKSFDDKCYELLKKVPRGKVVTYKEIAKTIGIKAYRAVGMAMHRNHDKDIPCHRVVCSDGKVGRYNKGVKRKTELLRKEGLEINNKRVDLEKFGFKF